MTTPALPNLKHLRFGGAGAVEDPDMHELVKSLVTGSVSELDRTTIHLDFLEKYLQWIKSSQLNALQGLDAFPVKAYSNGTTEAFDKFYLKNHQRRFRCLRGEYMYHVGTWKSYHDWAYLDQDQLRENDALVLSLPFSDLGDIHPDTNTVLDECQRLGIPVLLDCAFFGLCAGIFFNLDHPAVTDVTFSLSKTLPVAFLRIGMRLTRTDDDDSLLIYNKTGYVNRIGTGVGSKVLDIIDADYMWQKWHQTQQSMCEQLQVAPSKTVIFGIGGENYQEYNRGGVTNRLCLAKYLYQEKTTK